MSDMYLSHDENSMGGSQMGDYAAAIATVDKLDLQKIKDLQSIFEFKIVGGESQGKAIFNDILQVGQLIKKRLLGQVDTPDWIANYMAVLCIKQPKDRGIEPCFGRGVFITTIAKRLAKLNDDRWDDVANQITGIEIDPVSFIEGIREYQKLLPQRTNFENIYLGNFFDFHEDRGTYDFGIMNPPYVRQEELSSTSLPKCIRKESLLEALKGVVPAEYLSRKANLYFYFFLHLSSFLKEGGTLAAITYNSWLYTKSGGLLQRFFLDNFRIRYVIDFDREAFRDVIIGSCIVILEKTTGARNKSLRDDNNVKFVRLRTRASLFELISATESDVGKAGFVNRYMIRQAKLYGDDKWEKYFYLPNFHEELVKNPRLKPLKVLAHVFRGFVPLSSHFFILSKGDIKRLGIHSRYIIPILKDPRILRNLRTSDCAARMFFLHITQRKSELEKRLEAGSILGYLSYVEGEILKEPDRFKYVISLMQVDDGGWYIQKPNQVGEIVFGYIIRENKQFYLNDLGLVTTDNFHNIVPRVDKYALLAVLNSSLTKYLLETTGRTQGSGLLKVQVYELADLLVPDLTAAPKRFIQRLSEIGRYLTELDGRYHNNETMEQIIHKIDKLVFKFLDIDRLLEPVKQAETNIMTSRLSRKHSVSS